jgi:hypothetical protein
VYVAIIDFVPSPSLFTVYEVEIHEFSWISLVWRTTVSIGLVGFIC